MSLLRTVAFLLVLVVLAGAARAQTAAGLETAQGTVDKVDRDTLTVKTRGPDGRFGKNLVLKLTGTSKVWTVTVQARGGKPVITQRETDAKDLQPKQSVAVVYTTLKDQGILLTAVAEPAAGR